MSVRSLTSHWRPIAIAMCLPSLLCTGGAWFRSTPEWDVAIVERPYRAILPFGIETEITKWTSFLRFQQANCVLC